MFLHSKHIEDDVELGANPHEPFHFQTFCNLCYRGAVDGGCAVSWWADATQDVQERRFPSSAVSQQSCDLTLVDVKRQTWGKAGFTITLRNLLRTEQWLFVEQQITSETKPKNTKALQLTSESLHHAVLLFVHFVDVGDAARTKKNKTMRKNTHVLFRNKTVKCEEHQLLYYRLVQ